MSILNVNTIQPVGSGQTITVSATNISAPSTVVTASNFVGNVSITGGTLSGISTIGVTTAYVGSINDGPISGARNRIINGDMRIDQRNAGAVVTFTNAAVPYITDRFQVSLYGSTYSNPVMTAQQVTDAPTGFTNSLKITSSSTITPDSNKLGCWIIQAIEGFNSADLGWGSAGASSVVITFRVKSSKTGTMSVSLENSAADRSYLTTVTINAANTWETKTVVVPGDTTGTWLTNNGIGIKLIFGIMSNGSWLTGTGGSWQTTRALLSTSQTNFIATSGDNVSITGVQLEAGTVATPFERRSYGQELALCQRYYEKSYDISTAPADGATSDNRIAIGCIFNSTSFETQYISFSVRKRVAPTVITFYRPNFIAGTGVWAIYEGGSGWQTRTMGTSAVSEVGFKGTATVTGSNTQALICSGHWTASAEL